MARLCLRSGRKVPDASKVSKSAILNQSILQLNRTQYAYEFTWAESKPNSHKTYPRIWVVILAAIPEAYEDLLRSKYGLYSLYSG